METGIWLAEQEIQYTKMMLCHNIKNSDDNTNVNQIIKG